MERRALPNFALCPGPSSMPLNDPPHAGQAHACAGEFARVEASEWLEQRVLVGRIEADAVVTYVALENAGTGWFRDEVDAAVLVWSGELPGVAQQVLEDGRDELAVGLGDDSVLDLEVDAAGWVESRELRGDSSRDAAQIDGLRAHLDSGDPRELENVVDELSHPDACRLDTFHITAAFFVELDVVLIEENLAEAGHRSQGRTQVVGNGIREGL